MKNIIELFDDSGNKYQFEYLDLIKYKGREYIVLLDIENDLSGVILESIDGKRFLSVDDQSIVDAVSECFKEKYKTEFNFEE